MRIIRFGVAAFLAAVSGSGWAEQVRLPSDPVVITSPAHAVATALNHSPALRGAAASRQAVRGEGLQAGLHPNPEGTLTVENFGGIGGGGYYRGFAQTETTLGVSQRLELGGKRKARVGFAGRNDSVASLDLEAARLDLTRDVVIALAEATAAQRLAEVEHERVRLANETLRAVQARIDAGKEALLPERRAEVARTTAEIAAERARREAETALRNLAVLMGVTRISLAGKQHWFDDIGAEPRPPTPADPLVRLETNPDLTRLDAVIAQRRADVALQRANAVPDVTVQGGVRRFEQGRETAFVASVAVPLPVYDRNQGGIARATAELTRAEAEAERGRQALAATLVAAERRAEVAWRAAQSLRRVAVPSAAQAAGFAGTGYAEGKFGFLDVLDAQRALFDTRALLNDALREVHVRRAEVERLRGQEAGSPAQAGAR